MSNYGFEDYARNPFLATEALADLLRDGALRLFLGAGVSEGFGLPGWPLLLARLLGNEEVLSTGSQAAQQRALDALDDGGAEFMRKVQEALYRGVPADLGDLLPKSPLLLVIAAMATGAHRGRIDSVVTYNYDDVLEQYLKMLGLSVWYRTNPDSLSARCDLEINYVHGRLPQHLGDSGTGSASELVLSEKSYRAKRATIDEGWPAFVEHGLRSKIGLFVGLSGNDSTMLDLLHRAHRDIKRRGQDFLGYWLLTPEAYDANWQAIKSVGVCPLRLTKEDIPRFLFRTCARAALQT